MAQYRAIIQGGRGAASRLGTKRSGIRADVAGWNQGVIVRGQYNEEAKADKFHITVNGGNGWSAPTGDGYIGSVSYGGRFEPSPELKDRIIREWAASMDLTQGDKAAA